jgi:hypothetical protein
MRSEETAGSPNRKFVAAAVSHLQQTACHDHLLKRMAQDEYMFTAESIADSFFKKFDIPCKLFDQKTRGSQSTEASG